MEPVEGLDPLRRRGPVAAAARRLQAQPLAGAQRARRLGPDLLTGDDVAPALAVLAAVGAGRLVAAPLGQQRPCHVLERLDLAYHAVAASPGARATRAGAQGVLDDAQREGLLERLDRGV